MLLNYKPSATEKEILDAAEKANAMEFIDRFPGKLDTVVGETGSGSGGPQRSQNQWLYL